MSDLNNDNLIDRAREVREEAVGMSWVPKAIDDCLEANDLEGLRQLIGEVEGLLAQENFYNADVLGDRDEY